MYLLLIGLWSLIPTVNIISLDYSSDSSITRYVWYDTPFDTISYRPTDLVIVNPRASLRYSDTYIASGYHYLRNDARDALYALADAYYTQTRQHMTLVSAYRSYAFQLSIVTDSCKQSRLCALPGRSEHQAGLAVDLWWRNSQRLTTKSREYERLRQHAHTYGRHQTYQYGSKVDGYARELRHWRYVGVPLATFLHTQKLSFAQRHVFIRSNNN